MTQADRDRLVTLKKAKKKLITELGRGSLHIAKSFRLPGNTAWLIAHDSTAVYELGGERRFVHGGTVGDEIRALPRAASPYVRFRHFFHLAANRVCINVYGPRSHKTGSILGKPG